MGRKQPRIVESVDTRKRPRALTSIVQRIDRPIYSFALFDAYCWRLGDGSFNDDLFSDIVRALRDNARRTWAEIDRENSMNHWIDVSRFPAEARNRLAAIKFDDFESLFSLRISGTRRLYGIREDPVFYVIWWDPHHRAYPV